MASSVDAAVAAVAVPQCGAFSIRQAKHCGADNKLIARRCRAGRWLRGPEPVLQLPGFPAEFEQRLWWAVLVAGRGAVVSHWAAAALHGLVGFPPTRLTITVPHGWHHAGDFFEVFQTRAPSTPVLVRGLPVTPIDRTLVDVARLVGPKRLGAAVEDADATGRCSIPKLQRTFLGLARPGRNGISTMRTVLDARVADAKVPPRATLERHLDHVLVRLGIPFEREAPLPGREWSRERVDRVFREPRRLVVEGDGRRWHTRTADFSRDAQRRRAALMAGYPTANFLYEELRDDPDAIEAELRQLLGLRSGS